MQRDIYSFPLTHHVRGKLVHCGYVTANDFEGVTVDKLSSVAEITTAEAENVLRYLGTIPHRVTARQVPKPVLASDQLEQIWQTRSIYTFSQSLDELLDGGIRIGRLTEVCGMPGSGKTQLCLQLSVSVQIPEHLGGLGGEALYIDTEGSFSVERLLDMATAVTNHFNSMTDVPKESGEEQQLSVQGILSGVHYHRCLDFAAFIGLVNILPDVVTSHPKIRLIIIDNITYHFRHHFDSNYQLRTNILQSISSALNELASKHPLAVIITNQMTTRISKTGRSSIVPALGDNWSHACCNRLCLAEDDRRRHATLLKSSYAASATASFHIETAGIRDLHLQSASMSGWYNTGQKKLTSYQNHITAGNHEGAEECILFPVSKRPRLEPSD